MVNIFGPGSVFESVAIPVLVAAGLIAVTLVLLLQFDKLPDKFIPAGFRFAHVVIFVGPLLGWIFFLSRVPGYTTEETINGAVNAALLTVLPIVAFYIGRNKNPKE